MRQTRLRSSTAFPSTDQGYWCASTLLLCAAALIWTAGISIPAHGQEPSPAQVQSVDPATGTGQPDTSPAPASPAEIPDQNGSGVPSAPQAQNVPSESVAQPASPPAESAIGTEIAPQGTAQALNQPVEPSSPAQPAEAPGTPAFVPNASGFAGAAAEGSEARDDLPHDLSPWGMFMAADVIVKGVMILLAVASVLSWTIWFAKLGQVTFATRRLQRGLQQLYQDASLAEAAQRRRSGGPLGVMITAAHDEVLRSDKGTLPAAGIKERVSSQLVRIEASASRTMSSGTGMLATIGATAPFIGLFGTVWGIMNSFIGISEAQTTNLAVVAPGIAEALLATGIGLVAAIPAVIFYNHLARLIAGYKAKLADCGAMIERMVSRDLDRQSMQTH